MPGNEILIHLGEQGWLATYHGPHAAKIVNLFGTCTIATAWTPRAPLATVIQAIKILNPCVDVKPWN